MISKTIYEILLDMEGDIYDYDNKHIYRVFDNWEELIRAMIYRLEETTELKGDSDNIKFITNRAKTTLVNIRTDVDHIVRRLAKERDENVND